MAIQKLHPSYRFNEEQLKQLRQITPEAFKDNILDFNSLYESLSEYVNDEDIGNEYFELSWPGKSNSKKLTAKASSGSIIPENIGNGFKNAIIRGDNLEVLKLFQKSYNKQIKVIYIDPPYNTGSDLVYDDDFSEPLEDYLRRTGQMDEEGRAITTNTRADGRFHSKWLSMMYPRIKLARNLLKEDGVIFISIDDNEIHNLLALCNEIFGEENYVSTLKWKRKKQPSFLHGHVASIMEYVVIYAFNKENLEKLSIETRSDSNTRVDNATNNEAIRIFKPGVRVKINTNYIHKGVYQNKSMQTEYLDDITVKNGKTVNEFRAKAKFRNEQKEIERFIDNNVLFITKNYGFRRDLLPEEVEKRKSIIDLLLDWGDNQESDNEMKELYPEGKPFDYPKPTMLITNLLSSVFIDDEIVLDFFAGSGTTAHAVYKLQKNEKLNVKYILVTYPENISEKSEGGKNAIKLGFKTVDEICIDRVKRVYKKMFSSSKLDFNIYSLGFGNFKKWKNYKDADIKDLETLFSQFESPLIDNWKPENLLIEILLLEGFPLDSNVELVESFVKNKVQRVSSDFCEHSLFICLDKKIEDETIKGLSLGDNDIFICLDNALADQEKARLDDKGLIKTI